MIHTQNNPNLGINSEFNELVTMYSNDVLVRPMTKCEIDFLKKAYSINVIAGRTWSKNDFYPMSDVSFRQMVHKLSKIIKKVIDSRPPFYKLHHTYLDDSLTQRYTGNDKIERNVSLDFENILHKLRHQPPMMHDLRIETRTTELYENLLKQPDIKPNNYNKAFTIDVPVDRRFSTKVNVYKNKILLMIGCTKQPIPYSNEGFAELIFHLGNVKHYLTIRGNAEFVTEPVARWIIKYFHFNRDGVEIKGSKFTYAISDVQRHSEFYLKRLEDGKLIHRYEEKRTPNCSINTEMCNIEK